MGLTYKLVDKYHILALIMQLQHNTIDYIVFIINDNTIPLKHSPDSSEFSDLRKINY